MDFLRETENQKQKAVMHGGKSEGRFECYLLKDFLYLQPWKLAKTEKLTCGRRFLFFLTHSHFLRHQLPRIPLCSEGTLNRADPHGLQCLISYGNLSYAISRTCSSLAGMKIRLHFYRLWV